MDCSLQSIPTYVVHIFLLLCLALHLSCISRYNAHINVECVMSLAAAKYITKYAHKGPDRATIEIQHRDCDEVSEFKDSRYIAATEAA